MYPAKLSKLEARLDSQLPLLGGCLRQRAAQALARDGSPDAVRSLAKAVTRSDDRQVLAIALDALRQIRKQQCIDEVCAVWAVTRHKDLASLLIKEGWIASTPVDVKVLSALKAEKLEVVTKGGAEIVEPLLKAFSDADSEIASGASQCAIALTNPDAIDYLCERWFKTRERLLEQVVLQGGYVAQKPIGVKVLSALKTGKRQTIGRDGKEIVTPLLQACKDSDPKIAAEATALLGELQNQLAIDALCREWAKTRAKHLTETLQRGQYVATSPPEVRVLSALKVGRLEAVIDDGVEVVDLLLQACKDADFDIAREGQSALRKLKNPKAQDMLCRLVIEQDHQLAREIAVASQYTPRDSNQRALLYFLTEQWDKYESLDFEHTLLQTAYEIGDEQLRQRIAQKVRQAGRAEWVQIIAGGRQGNRLGEMTDAEWETTLVVLNHREQWEEMWRLAQSASLVWSLSLLKRLKETRWFPSTAESLAIFSKLMQLIEKCTGKVPDLNGLFFQTISTKHIGYIARLVISPDGRLLATSGGWPSKKKEDKTVCLWSLPDGKILQELDSHTDIIWRLDISTDGRLLVVGVRNGKIYLYTLPEGNILKILECLEILEGRDPWGCLNDLTISHNGQLLVTACSPYGGSNTIKLWSLPSGELLRTLCVGSLNANCLAISPDGKLLVSGDYQKVTLWSLQDGQLIKTLKGHKHGIDSLAISPNGQILASASGSVEIRLWSLPDGQALKTLSESGSLKKLAISPDGQVLISMISRKSNDEISFWSLPDGQKLKSIVGIHFAISPNGRILATAVRDNSVLLYSLPDGQLLKTLKGHTKGVSSLAFSANGRFLTTGSQDKTVRLWSLCDLSYLSRLSVNQTSTEDMQCIQEALQNRNLSDVQQGWLEFSLTLMRWQRRFDVEVEDMPQRIDAGEFDIEIEG